MNLEQLKAAAQAVIDAELVTGYAIIAPSSEEFDKIVKQRKRELEQAIHALGKVLRTGKSEKEPSESLAINNEVDALKAEIANLRPQRDRLMALSAHLEVENEQLKAKLASTKEALDFAESARADWSKRYIWLMTEVCDALGIDKDNTPAVDIVLCVRNLMQRDTQLINVELLAALKAMVAEYGEFYGDTPDVAAQCQSPLIKNAMQVIDKAEEAGGVA